MSIEAQVVALEDEHVVFVAWCDDHDVDPEAPDAAALFAESVVVSAEEYAEWRKEQDL